MNLEDRLVGNGLIFREARLKGQSISGSDRKVVLRARDDARRAGYQRHAINALEMRGERGEWGLRPRPIEATFRCVEKLPNGFTKRWYDVRGDHPLNNSTVDVMGLVHAGIWPLDITPVRVAYEYVKDALALAWFTGWIWFEDLKTRIRGNRS